MADLASNISTRQSRLWLYLHFPLLPLEIAYNERDPGPAALLDQHQRLWLCNPKAQHHGLKPGMAVATACSLCPVVKLFNRQLPQEQQQLESLAIWAGSFSGQISLQADYGILLESTSMLPYFQGFTRYHQKLTAQLNTLGFNYAIATGYTPLAARLLARNGGYISTDHKQLLTRILQLPVTHLEQTPKIQERLTGMGLMNLQQLLELPRNELASRLGAELVSYIDRLCGNQPDPPRLFVPPLTFQRHLDLNHEIENSQALVFPLRRLLASLEGYLQSRQLQALQLRLEMTERKKAENDSASVMAITVKHGSGEYRSEVWLELWRLRLERLQLQQPIISLKLSVNQFAEQQHHNQGLLSAKNDYSKAPVQANSDQHSPSDLQQQLLSRLRTRLGEKAVSRLGLAADHRPEKSWQKLPLEKTARPSTGPKKDCVQRPYWLLEQPKGLPEQQLQNGLIQLLQGPERIASGWWDNHPVRRDYYIGRWPDGRLGWLYRDDQGHWYLHGWFG